jgi:hypothetical protein
VKAGDLVILSHDLTAEGISGFWGWSDSGDLWISNGTTAIITECGEHEQGFDSIIQILCCGKILDVPAARVRVISDD